ncbi:hypothetical protein FQA39_LY16487 [Lamprigera yunnana]|nr:hypothetical protein FQA39_LY16487 [Lamprigera yunnana]
MVIFSDIRACTLLHNSDLETSGVKLVLQKRLRQWLVQNDQDPESCSFETPEGKIMRTIKEGLMEKLEENSRTMKEMIEGKVNTINEKFEEKLISNMSSTLRGKHLHAQACEMAFNVYQWIKSQNEDQCIKEIKEKVSRATGVSGKTIERFIKEGSTSPEAETDKQLKS